VPDLYSGDIDSIKIADVEDFLFINKPEDQRPPENARIDYKEAPPSDIGLDVASMANADGGLILVGVKASKAKQNVPVQIVGVGLGGDAKARITDWILATVRPRPPFEIAIIPYKQNGQVIALIRVRPGSFPPYEFQQGATVKIPIRTQDSNRQATLSEIESLLERRNILGKPAQDLASGYLGSTDFYCTVDAPSGESRVNEYQMIFTIPRSPLRFRLDAIFHKRFEESIKRSFGQTIQFARRVPRGRFYQVEQRLLGSHYCCRIWRAWRNGAIGFVGNLARRGLPGEFLGDICEDFQNLCRFARSFFREEEYFGPLVLAHELSCDSVQFLPTFSWSDALGDEEMIEGIHFPQRKAPTFKSHSQFYEEIDFVTLENPENVVAETLLFQLQETCGASIMFDKFKVAIARIRERA